MELLFIVAIGFLLFGLRDVRRRLAYLESQLGGAAGDNAIAPALSPHQPRMQPVTPHSHRRDIETEKPPARRDNERKTGPWLFPARLPARKSETREPEPEKTEKSPQLTQTTQSAQPLVARFENLFGRTLPIWAGGLTLAIAGVLIVRYAIDAGFFARVFTPSAQVFAGFMFGLGLICGAEYAWRHEDKVRDKRVAQALAGAGVSTLYAAILVAANIYGLIGPTLAFCLLAGITASALGLALRFGAPTAILGLVGGLAAPALIGAVEPNVPLLSLYLGLTIAGLTGVSRARAWPWLAVAALIGGLGWGLWLAWAGEALDVLASLSVGGFILLLAIALPLLSYQGPRSALVQSAAAIAGALQLAILVSAGGFSLLHWGLFVLIVAAGQWLAWKDRQLAIIPGISLLLSVALLSLWEAPSPLWFTVIGCVLLLIHALPLLARLWTSGKNLRPALELCVIAAAIPLLAKWQFSEISDARLGVLAMLGSALLAAAILRGWTAQNRAADARFSVISAAAAALLSLALGLLLPLWMLPMVLAMATAGLVFFGKAAQDHRLARAAALFLAIGIAALIATLGDFASIQILFGGSSGWDGQAILRWTSLTLAALVIAMHAADVRVSRFGQICAALLAYGTAAQWTPGPYLALLSAAGGAAALLCARKYPPARVMTIAATFAVVSLTWASWPLFSWLTDAMASISGIPFYINGLTLPLQTLLLRLLIPALLFAGAMWMVRAKLPERIGIAALVVAATILGITLHILYRLGFASIAGDDFVATGLSQRLIWSGLLVGAAWLLHQRGRTIGARTGMAAGAAHLLFYSLLLHNPLWANQQVGGLPIINLLIPLYALAGFAVVQLIRLCEGRFMWLERAGQLCLMLLVTGFAWSTLRQLFHGTSLIEAGVSGAENIMRSFLLLGLAIGFLLWGIRHKAHDWRIASLILMIAAAGKVFLLDASGLEGLARIGSFVALGFSLIGIGWLYSRQLSPGRQPE